MFSAPADGGALLHACVSQQLDDMLVGARGRVARLIESVGFQLVS